MTPTTGFPCLNRLEGLKDAVGRATFNQRLGGAVGMADDLWYYAEGSTTKGPVYFEQLVTALKRMPQSEEVLVWQQGFADWVEARSIPELNRLLVRPPPLPNKRPVSHLSPEYRQAEASDPARWKRLGASLVGWVIGIGLARLLGASFWIPAITISLSYWVFSRLKVASPVSLMLSVLVGHTLWIAIGQGSLVMLGKPSPDLAWFSIDIVATLIFAIWCAKRKSTLSCFFVFLYQLIGLTLLVANFEDTVKVSEVAAFVHLFLRLTGLGLAAYAGVTMRKRRDGKLNEETIAV
jgi:hypothetical protein